MSKEYEEWLSGKILTYCEEFECAQAFEAGQQSQQTKIDELQIKLDSLQHSSDQVVGAISFACGSYLDENKKLQRTIDGIKNHLEGLSEKHVSTHAYLGFLDILDILKGNKDD